MTSLRDAFSLAELDKAMDQMTEDYCNPEENRYDVGPGADLDDCHQVGALAAAKKAAEEKPDGGMTLSETPAVRIHLKNTRSLTEEGLRALCQPYGNVVAVHKPKQDANTAFVEFSNQSEAGLAIQALGSKLGFQFYPAFAREKKALPLQEMIKMPGPPPPFTADPGERLVHVLDDKESWEPTTFQRNIRTGLSVPLKIAFPERVTFATAPHYVPQLGQLSALSRVDATGIFSVVTMVEEGAASPVKSSVDNKIIDRIDGLVQREAVSRLQPTKDANGKVVYVHRGLSREHSELFPESRCVACGLRGFFSCADCQATYCSRHCQHEDYAKHRKSCAAGGLENGEAKENNAAAFEDLDDASLTQEPFPKGAHVMILSVLGPNRVYVRALEPESNKKYMQTVSDIAKAGLTAEPLNHTPEAGDICLAFYEPLQIYGRVLLINVTGKQAHCVFIDFALFTKVNSKDLKQFNDSELKLRPVRVHKVHLKGITEEFGHIDSAISYLTGLANQPLEMKSQLEAGNIVDAELRTAGGNSVNKRINHLITIPVVKVIETLDSFVDYNTVPAKKLPPNQTMDVMILNRTTILLDFRVSLIAFEDLPYLEDLQRKLQSYGRKVEKHNEHYTPRLNELCLVRQVGTWYRGVCREVVGDGKPTLFLCDYGCMVLAKLDDIRKIPPSLALEVRSTDAKIFGLEEGKKAGIKIDSELLDIFLGENERLTVQTSEEVEFSEFEEVLDKSAQAMISVIKVPDLLKFIEDREHCGEFF